MHSLLVVDVPTKLESCLSWAYTIVCVVQTILLSSSSIASSTVKDSGCPSNSCGILVRKDPPEVAKPAPTARLGRKEGLRECGCGESVPRCRRNHVLESESIRHLKPGIFEAGRVRTSGRCRLVRTQELLPHHAVGNFIFAKL